MGLILIGDSRNRRWPNQAGQASYRNRDRECRDRTLAIPPSAEIFHRHGLTTRRALLLVHGRRIGARSESRASMPFNETGVALLRMNKKHAMITHSFWRWEISRRATYRFHKWNVKYDAGSVDATSTLSLSPSLSLSFFLSLNQKAYHLPFLNHKTPRARQCDMTERGEFSLDFKAPSHAE